jgi:hypothetical protein
VAPARPAEKRAGRLAAAAAAELREAEHLREPVDPAAAVNPAVAAGPAVAVEVEVAEAAADNLQDRKQLQPRARPGLFYFGRSGQWSRESKFSTYIGAWYGDFWPTRLRQAKPGQSTEQRNP